MINRGGSYDLVLTLVTILSGDESALVSPRSSGSLIAHLHKKVAARDNITYIYNITGVSVRAAHRYKKIIPDCWSGLIVLVFPETTDCTMINKYYGRQLERC
jgi:hypothetical protein